MFWSNFKKLCAEKGEAANVVAAKCGVKSTGTVTGWKNGAIPSPKTLSKIADYFGITVAELIDEEQKNKLTTQEGDEVDELLTDLSPEERARVADFIGGLIASRKDR